MGYLLILFSALGSLGKGMFGKGVSRTVHALPDVIMTNVIRMALCTLISLGIVGFTEGLPALGANAGTVFSAMLYGASLAAAVTLWLICIRFCEYMHVDVFESMEVIVSMVLCALFLKEGATLLQAAGTAMLLLANILLFLEKKSSGKQLSLKALLMLSVYMIVTGMMDFAQKLFVHVGQGASSAVYNFYAFLFTMLFLAAAFAVCRKRSREKFDPAPVRRVFPLTAAMAVCMFVNAYFKVMAGALLNAAILIPVYKGTETILSVLGASFILKEKPTRVTLLAVALVFAAIVIINL